MDLVSFDVKIPKLDRWVADRLRESAKSATPEGTIRAYVEKILTEEAHRNQRIVYGTIQARREKRRVKHPNGHGTNSVEIIRAIRDGRS